MRTSVSMVLGMVLLASGAQARELPPGNPAGVKKAGLSTNAGFAVITIGLGAAIAGLGVMSVSGDKALKAKSAAAAAVSTK